MIKGKLLIGTAKCIGSPTFYIPSFDIPRPGRSKRCIKSERFTGLQFKLAIILSYALQKMQNTKIYNSPESNANVDFRKIRRRLHLSTNSCFHRDNRTTNRSN
jgi:hypothetical protein